MDKKWIGAIFRRFQSAFVVRVSTLRDNMNQIEMKNVLESTLRIQAKNAKYMTVPLMDVRLKPPVPGGDMASLKEHVQAQTGASIPPSFIQFLQIADGIAGFMQVHDISLRSARQIIDSATDDEYWDDFSPLHKFVIGSGDTGAFIAFDSSRVDAAGEMPIVLVDERGGQEEHTNFEAFLKFQLQYQTNVLEVNEG